MFKGLDHKLIHSSNSPSSLSYLNDYLKWIINYTGFNTAPADGINVN